MDGITKSVQQQILRFNPGTIFSIKEIHRFGISIKAVYQAVYRLNKQGTIRRIKNGIYYKPEKNRILLGRYLIPDIYQVVQFIAVQNGENIQVHGGMAAFRLQLSTQVPVMEVFYTSGNSRQFQLGGTQIRLIHTNNSQFFQYPLGSRIGMAISALLFFGKEIVDLWMIEKA